MKEELHKYIPSEFEKSIFEIWQKNDLFKANVDREKKPYVISMPPPNITGKLHLGHALDLTLQDILIRFKRMQGYEALWVPGEDHASIATEVRVENELLKDGIKKEELGREKFLEKVWQWTETYRKKIREQIETMGASCDFSREAFTMDNNLSKAVREVFVKLYNQGYIYQGNRITNWCPKCTTALSDAEIEYKEMEGKFWHIKYPLEDGSGYLEIATTRPETMLGDVAVMVHPEDERYKKYIGKNVILPLVGRKIPVISDSYVDMEFATGVVKVTPAHDPNDYEVGIRHNLPQIKILDEKACINENGFEYEGLYRYDARQKIVEDLDKNGFLISVKSHIHNVSCHDRCGTIIEPMISKQWYVKMDELAKPAIECVKNKEVSFIPERFEKIYFNWMDNIKDWCISRQLWWGHRIPAWYRGDEVYVGLSAPEGDGWVQDDDVLDTWFSSALWPFSTLGWPEETDDFKRYYPNNVLVTGYDIIPFWVNRMTFQGLEFTGKRPFKDCLIHGLIRDKEGRKMSKSLGNGVDPMDVIDEYGADSLRFYLTTNTAPGTDLRYDEEKVKSTWNFINKLWNASRYVLMNIDDLTKEEITFRNLSKADKWILTAKNQLIQEVTKNMDSYDFQNVGNALYQFIWEDFCDNYIELSKALMNDTTKSVLLDVLTTILKLLHPFMPYVTEEIYDKLPVKASESIMISSYPIYNENEVFVNDYENVRKAISDLTEIRNLKVTNGVKKDAKVQLDTSKDLEYIYRSQLKITDDNLITNNDDITSYQTISYQSPLVQITYYFENEINKEQLKEEIKKLKSSIERREKLLSNENYVNKAPKNIVDMDRVKLKEEQEKLKSLESQL